MDDEQWSLLLKYTHWLEEAGYLNLQGVVDADLLQAFDNATADPEAADAAGFRMVESDSDGRAS